MAENPQTWNNDIKRIYHIIKDAESDNEAGICGLSTPRKIYDEIVAPLQRELAKANKKATDYFDGYCNCARAAGFDIDGDLDKTEQEMRQLGNKVSEAIANKFTMLEARISRLRRLGNVGAEPYRNDSLMLAYEEALVDCETHGDLDD